MTRYIKLTRDDFDGGSINFAWGAQKTSSIGAWIEHPTPISLLIGQEIVKLVQHDTKHNRRWMKNPKNCRTAIIEMVHTHNLKVEEKVVTEGQL